LDKIKITAGEFSLDELSAVMSREIHIRSAVETYETYGEERQSVLVFAVTIAHAEKLAEAFNSAGHPAAAVHSELAKDERRGVLASFEAGKIKILVNVGVLTEGWDSPKVDCVLMCRPTRSPGLFVQMIGRGTRLFEGKDDVLILDLAENFNRHGDPSDPQVRIARPASGGVDDLSQTPFKICPKCMALVPLAMKVCPDCEHRFAPEEKPEVKRAPEMVEIKRVEDTFNVRGYTVEPYRSRKGNKMLRLSLSLENTDKEPCYYLGFSPHHHRFFRGKSVLVWHQLAGFNSPAPRSDDEALNRLAELDVPSEVTLYKDENNYLKVREIQ
jgi:DNA repair protein RadD